MKGDAVAPTAPLKTLVAPAARAITHLRDSLTYDDIPCAAQARPDSRPYLGHVPYFAPKLASDSEHREQQPQMHQVPRCPWRYSFGA